MRKVVLQVAIQKMRKMFVHLTFQRVHCCRHSHVAEAGMSKGRPGMGEILRRLLPIIPAKKKLPKCFCDHAVSDRLLHFLQILVHVSRLSLPGSAGPSMSPAHLPLIAWAWSCRARCNSQIGELLACCNLEAFGEDILKERRLRLMTKAAPVLFILQLCSMLIGCQRACQRACQRCSGLHGEPGLAAFLS